MFYLDRVLQRVVEQIIDDDMVGWAGFKIALWSRTSWRWSGGAVLRRDAAPGRARAVLTWKFGHCFYELLFWQTLALVFMRPFGGFRKNFPRFLREDEP